MERISVSGHRYADPDVLSLIKSGPELVDPRSEVIRRAQELNQQLRTYGAVGDPRQRIEILASLAGVKVSPMGGSGSLGQREALQCGHERNVYNSCANRHCPRCPPLARAEWLEKRQGELLQCDYFHVVLTLPEPLAALALHDKREMYGLLFRATAETLQEIRSRTRCLTFRRPTRYPR